MATDTTSQNGSSTKKFVQLTKLPNLEEVPMENPMEQLLTKSILLQLKTMNKNVTMSELAFEDLCQFVSLQMDDMLQCFRKITQIQRRNQISKIDLELFIKGTALTTADLNEQLEVSRYVHKMFPRDSEVLKDAVYETKKHYMKELDESELLSSKHSEFFVQDVDILNLLPSTNKSNKYVPSWLPDFPPDHTYRFTALYKKTITDERIMKQKLLQEGKKSEQALINMLSKANGVEKVEKDKLLLEQLEEAKAETEFIFMRSAKSKYNSSGDVLKTLPLKGFDVEKYCIDRVSIKRRKKEEQEKRAANKKRNPFLRSALLCSPYGSGGAKSRKSVENQLKLLLKRSYLDLIDSIPRTKAKRAEAQKEAEAREKELMEKKRVEKEKRMADQELLDLNNLQHDSFFHALDNESEEDEQEKEEHHAFDQHNAAVSTSFADQNNEELFTSIQTERNSTPAHTVSNEPSIASPGNDGPIENQDLNDEFEASATLHM